ncbi:unnamed protein product [Sphenostylis stenocarpa]|uniref:Uncharacterized protein n=1 Tax=Sphenostylis stenocarpa TaxID=92480 RepID=A0AA86W372_9FABA|nr:unnamed protein product [Sphenostylis stenocarpa]
MPRGICGGGLERSFVGSCAAYHCRFKRLSVGPTLLMKRKIAEERGRMIMDIMHQLQEE